jgi:ribonuclease HII
MHRIAEVFPEFGFEENVGYSTPDHRAAIMANGPSTLHRRSFQSIAYSQLELSG